MKHLVAVEHHPHLKKRAYLEFFGLLLLIAITIHQKELIATALKEIRNSDILYLLVTLAIYWLIVPLTAYSFNLLTRRRLPIFRTTLAQLAGAGPGRIIPGGLGHISIAAMHLNKFGLHIHKAFVIPLMNNLIGLITNMVLVAGVIVIKPGITEPLRDNVSTESVIFLSVATLILISLFYWLYHIRSTRKSLKKLNKQWNKQVDFLINHPNRVVYIALIAIIITVAHVIMLITAGMAIGMSINYSDALIALSVGVLVSGAVPTPGGLGAMEAGTISALIVLGYDPSQATGAALIFRTSTYWQPILPGILAYLYLRERKLL